ncbi:MAG TPA: hypothetical protein VFG69_11910 [Nannocystaceae bacterium]|nr:hypothetical protein [Nannocystaceae bacterium]
MANRAAKPSTSAILAALALALGSGCGQDEGSRTTAGSGGGIDTLPGDGGTGVGGPDDGADDGSGSAPGSGDDDGTPAFDLGGADDGMPDPDEGCRRVDFLFVIDNSASMEDQQAALVAAFPGFIAAIQATLTEADDYQILVTDTDDWGRCNTANPWNGVDPGSDLCNGYIKQTVFQECDRTLGAGVLHPAGDFATNAPCMIAGGNRWMTAMEPDLAGAFACVAQVGVAGNPAERPMDAMVAALQPEINEAGACNAGFLRDDALLVITFMSDDPHYEDADGPDEWYQAVLDAKLGDPTSVVVLGLTPAWPNCMDGGETKGAHWAEFVAKFGDYGLHGNICGTAEDFVTFFESAVSTIGEACEQFVPPG